MIGIVLAGGNGTRLKPLTSITNKHLLPVYNKPMIFFPIEFLARLKIKDIVIISGKEFAGAFANLLGDGSEFNIRLTYKVQNSALGIAHAIGLAENIAKGDSITVILGDNIFSLTDYEVKKISNDLHKFEKTKKGAMIFLKRVRNPQRFGVAHIKARKVINIEEKPKQPKSNLAVTGLYIYDNTVFDKIKELKPSWRNELEITDVNNKYIGEMALKYHTIRGNWTDAGTFESLFLANKIVREKEIKSR
ncbi:MAG: spore coat protein [Candidatus Micrarchaeum sp. AZ1]|nr:MAG: spore coat protein [Candidatus Micrarchaeum sp. AZ1]